MAFPYRVESREVIRVKAKDRDKLLMEKIQGSNPFVYHNQYVNVRVILNEKCDGLMQPEFKRFCIDPQITSFEMLQNLLARAFSIISDFTISYLVHDPNGHTTYLSLLSDWDMDAAFQTASDPCLKLKVDLKPFDEGLEDWDVIAPLDIPTNRFGSLFEKGSVLMSLSDTISSRVEKTMSQVNKAIGRKKSASHQLYKPLKSPMSDAEFHTYLDAEGRLIRPQEFRLSIYQGGIEPSLRRVAWRHLLNVFPPCLTGRERFDYMKERERQYYSLRDEWKKAYNHDDCPDNLKYVTSLVKKDVLRTDRAHGFYAGSDDNKNIVSLFHVLVTYAVTHPSVSYCQGMSDIASPLLVVQNDEAQAYICFCAIMNRLHKNFLLDGIAMTIKFQHLSDLLRLSVPSFHDYLTRHDAQDMFFCYRWLLLETKREFPLDNALYMLEVMWSTLPPASSDCEVTLTDRDYYTSNLSALPLSPPFTSKITVYTKFLTRHRQNSLHQGSLASSLDEQLVRNSVNNNNSTVCNCDCSPIYEDGFGTESSSSNFSSLEISLHEKSSQIDQCLKCNVVSRTSSRDETADSLSSSPANSSSVGTDAESLDDVASVKCNNCGKISNLNGDLKNISSTERSHWTISDIVTMRDNNCDANVTGNSESDEKSSSFELVNNAQETDCPRVASSDLFNFDFQDCEHQTSYQPSDWTNVVSSPNNDHEPKTNCGSQINTTALNDASQQKKSGNELELSIDENYWAEDVVTDKVNEGRTKDQGKACVDSVEQLAADSTIDLTDEERIQGGEDCLTFLEGPQPAVSLPIPDEFGAGNPFLMFICLAMILQHCDHIMRNQLDYDEMAMHFDRMVRKHQVDHVLHQARLLYCDYLRDQQRRATQVTGGHPSLS